MIPQQGPLQNGTKGVLTRTVELQCFTLPKVSPTIVANHMFIYTCY